MSTPIVILPDLEAVAGDYLRSHPDIIALNANVAGQIPKTLTRPWVRITQLDAANEAALPIDHLVTYLLQLDVWAGSAAANAQEQASTLTRTARAVLESMQGRAIEGVIVTDVKFRVHNRIPDLSFEPPRERFLLLAAITAHV